MPTLTVRKTLPFIVIEVSQMNPTHVLCALFFAISSGCESKPERMTAQPKQQQDEGSALGRAVPGESDSTSFRPFTCGSRAPGMTSDDKRRSEERHRGKALKVAKAVDFLSVRWVMGEATESIGEVGEACARANDQAACRAKLQTEVERHELTRTTCSEAPGAVCAQMVYALTTERDEVRVWRSAPEFQELIGSIRSPEAAWLLAQAELKASPYLCDLPDFAAQRATNEGYLLRERRYTKRCAPQELKEFIYRVTPAGVVTLVSQTVLASDPVVCENSAGH